MLILSFCIGISDSAAGDEEEDWPMFRLDYHHTGYKEGLAPDTNQTNWIFNTTTNDRWIVSSPMIVDDYVYIGSENGKLYKIDLYDGTEVWNYTADQGGGWAHFWSSPYVDKESNMVFCHADGVHAVNMTTGERIWRFDSAVREFSSPVVSNGVVFVGSYDNCIYALPQIDPNSDGNITNDEVIWIYYSGEYQNGARVEDTGGAVSTTLAVVDGMVLGAEQTQLDSGSSYCDYNAFCLPEVDPDSSGEIEHGEIIWKYEIGEHLPLIDTGVPGEGGDCFSSPSVNVDNGQVYIGSRDMYVYCLALEPQGDGLDNDGDGLFDNEGELIWRSPVDNEVYSSPSFHDGNVFIGSGMYNTAGSPGTVYCFRESDGGEVWSYPHTDGFLSSPMVADGKVFIGSNDDYLFAFNESDGGVLWSFLAETNANQDAFGSSPSLYDDMIVVGNCNGRVYNFKTPRVNYAPEIELVSPEHSTIFRSTDEPLLRWEGSDPNPSDELTYDVYLSDNENDVDLLRSSALVSEDQPGEEYRFTGAMEGEKYFWRIVVADTEYETESHVRSFTINTRPMIQLDAPENGSVESSSDVTISWNAEDDDGDDLHFDVYMDETTDPSSLVSEDQLTEEYEFTELEDGHTYYWTVVVSDGVEDVKSTVYYFEVDFQAVENTPPTVAPASPDDGSIFDTTSVFLQWGGDDEDEDAISYTLFMDTSTDPDTVIVDDTEDESYTVTDLQDGITYYWKVTASDGTDTTESVVWSFSIDLDLIENDPPTIELIMPLSGAILDSSTVQLLWSSEDPENDDLTFDVFIGIAPNSTTAVAQDIEMEKYQVPGLTFGQTYFWYVTASDGTSEVSSELRNFTLEEEEEDDESSEWYEEITDEPLYIGLIAGMIIIVVLVIALVSAGGRRYEDYENEEEGDWDDWD